MHKLLLETLPYYSDSSLLFGQLRDLTLPVFLDSASPYSQWGRYDIISAEPTKVLKETINANGLSNDYNQPNVFQAVKQHLNEYYCPIKDDCQLPFTGGAIGYFGYDLTRQLGSLPAQAQRDIEVPDALVGFYSWAIIVDHQKRCTWLMAHPNVDKRIITEARQRLNRFDITESSSDEFALTDAFFSNLSSTEYRRAFQRIKNYIYAGDCYQINLAQRFTAYFTGDPWHAYQRLRKVAAAPYSAYMEDQTLALMSMSPERFLEVRGQRVTSSPIKGTISRSHDAIKDQALAKQLLRSEKDYAENLMIVDLLRNDLSKHCQLGSVHVDALCQLQRFKTVHHLVSTIRGLLKKNITACDVLAGCFPGGSITGAPKIRAMEIIEALEPHRRSVYCGTIGYLSCDGQMDMNIAIRTLLCQHDVVYCWSGGGIVADSNCQREYQESFIKVNKLLAALQQFSKRLSHP